MMVSVEETAMIQSQHEPSSLHEFKNKTKSLSYPIAADASPDPLLSNYYTWEDRYGVASACLNS